MIKKTLATVIMLSSFAFTSHVMAAGLSDDMKVLGKNYKAFNQSDNPQAATTALIICVLRQPIQDNIN
jgi:soluble cytochrome b562